jgi:hypothetical protein
MISLQLNRSLVSSSDIEPSRSAAVSPSRDPAGSGALSALANGSCVRKSVPLTLFSRHDSL